jgi:gamma-glutamyltranspeptidase/glutathione hydrolase
MEGLAGMPHGGGPAIVRVRPTHAQTTPMRSLALRLPALSLLVALAAPESATTQSVRQAGRSQDGMVSTAHPLATDAGVRMLELGGNAADAAVAAGFAIAVVEPSMNSIGGRNQILVRTPDGAFHGIDGTTQAPWDYDPETAPQAAYGYAVIGIPGALAGLMKLHDEHGTLPRAAVMAPAIEYAERGFRVLPGEAARQASAADEALEFPGTAAAYYTLDGSPYRPGELLVQPDYASTLRKIVQGGREAFYEGEVARAMAADLAANGSTVGLEAIQGYEAEESRIVRGSYRGYELVGLDVPAAGVLAIEALQIMERFDADSMSEPEWFAVTAQALRIASRELRGLGTDTAAARATSKEWAARMAQEIAAPGRAPTVPGGEAGSAAGSVAAGSQRAGPHAEGPRTAPEAQPDLHGHTTHLSTADADGMVVSLTQTLGPTMGSKVVTPGLGFLYASTLGGYLSNITAGVRARSNICPFLVLRDGEVVLVLGAAGGGMIPPAVVHAVTRVIDFGMSLPEALAEPRVAGGGGGAFDAETSPDIGWTPDELDAMRALGIEVDPTPRSGAFGRVHGIQLDPEARTWIGAADPDWEGSARGPALVGLGGR